MVPYLSLPMRVLAWILWHFERFGDMDDACFCVIEHPDLLRVTGLLRDYWYIRQSRIEVDE